MSIDADTKPRPICIPAMVQGSTAAKSIKEIVIQLDSLSDKNDEYAEEFISDFYDEEIVDNLARQEWAYWV